MIEQFKIDRYRFFKFIIYFLSISLLTFICSPKFSRVYKDFQSGTISDSEIKAPDEIEYTPQANERTQESKDRIFEDIRNTYKFENINIVINDTNYLKDNIKIDDHEVIDEANRLLQVILTMGYKEKEFEEKDRKKGITFIFKQNNVLRKIEKQGKVFSDFSASIIQGEDKLIAFIKKNSKAKNEKFEIIAELIRKAIVPNIVIDNESMLEEYNKRMENIKIQPVKIKSGDILIKKGETISKEKYEILVSLNQYQWNADIKAVIVIFLTFVLAFVFIEYYFNFFIAVFTESLRNYIVFFFLLLIPAFLMKIYLVLINSSDFAPKLMHYIFIVPIEASAILSVILLFRRTGIIVALLTAYISTLVFAVYSSYTLFSDIGYSVVIFSTVFFSSMTGVFFMSKAKHRDNLLKSGFFISISNILFLFFSEKLYESIYMHHLDIPFAAYMIMFVKGLLLTPSFVTGLMPLFEKIFNLTTDYRLLELSDISHPLLKELAMKAPGTYQHSLTLANLAESAAQAINANPLLARVGAYYHDIGKMFKPDYFIENQNYMENPHDHIKPSLSNSILKAHVKQGLELADKWKLPIPVKDMIQQHHGKSLMLYFYNAALKTGEHVEENAYRYGGPSPTFKESAILSMADTIEAMTRTLKNPTQKRISEMVNNSIKKKILDGDLDGSELTLREVKTITEVFIRILTTMYHSRIEYPDANEIKKNEEEQKRKTKSNE